MKQVKCCSSRSAKLRAKLSNWDHHWLFPEKSEVFSIVSFVYKSIFMQSYMKTSDFKFTNRIFLQGFLHVGIFWWNPIHWDYGVCEIKAYCLTTDMGLKGGVTEWGLSKQLTKVYKDFIEEVQMYGIIFQAFWCYIREWTFTQCFLSTYVCKNFFKVNQ